MLHLSGPKIFERDGSSLELCRNCAQGQKVLIGKQMMPCLVKLGLLGGDEAELAKHGVTDCYFYRC